MTSMKQGQTQESVRRLRENLFKDLHLAEAVREQSKFPRFVIRDNAPLRHLSLAIKGETVFEEDKGKVEKQYS